MCFCLFAQQRPGSKPRQPPRRAARWPQGARRSTKARVETPATLVGRIHVPYVVDRSTKARVETPATPRILFSSCIQCSTALNKGQGRNPGNPALRQVLELLRSHRSTKARVETPATLAGSRQRPPCRYPLNKGQGRNPGNPGTWTPSSSNCSPLNKGQGRNPGNPRSLLLAAIRDAALNKGQGRNPGNPQ